MPFNNLNVTHMKKFKFSTIFLLCALALTAVFSGCDEEEFVAGDIREAIAEPVISEFTPQTGSAGTTILVKGDNLATVNHAYIGGIETKIENRISNSQILLKVIGLEVTGPIKLVNNKGESQSSGNFAMQYVVPAISAITPNQTGFTLRDKVTITGTNLKAVLEFYFGTVKAEVLSLSDTQAEITVPFVEADKARIRLKYYGEGTEKYVESALEYDMLKPVVEPTIASVPDEVEEGNTFVITGEDLDRINKVLFGDIELVIESASFDQVVVLFPEGILEADTYDQLIAIHNGTVQLVLNPNFLATMVPLYPYYFWQNIELSAHEGGSTFFSAKDGMAFDNCSAPSFVNDLDFSGYITNARYFTIYGPHNTTNVLRNYKCGETGLDELMGNAYLSIETRFRVLDPNNAAHQPLIAKVKDGNIDDVNIELFEGIADPSGSTATNRWDQANQEMVVGSVVYFWNKKKDKRGILHIKSINVNYEVLDRTSTITFDVYYER